MKTRIFAALALSTSLFAGLVNAAPILSNAVAIQAISATATSNYGAPYTADKTIDQGGMSATYVSGVTAASAIDGYSIVDYQQVWHGSANTTSGSITFDLGSSYTLDRIFLFWTNGGSGNNISDFNVDISDTANFASFVTAATFGTPSGAMNRIDFASLATGEFVRLSWSGLQGSYPGLGEFVAGGIPANQTPEPSSIALLGLALAAASFKRKRSN